MLKELIDALMNHVPVHPYCYLVEGYALKVKVDKPPCKYNFLSSFDTQETFIDYSQFIVCIHFNV